MKRAVEEERDRAAARLSRNPRRSRSPASCPRLAGAERPPGGPRTGLGRYHDPAFPMALSLAELLPGDEPRTPVGHVPYERSALGDPMNQVAMAIEKAVGPRAGVGLKLAVAQRP